MATRTIAIGGGNWDSTATWVEGAVPVAGDDVVATVTSGQLTVNVASACATLVLTGYANTMTWNANVTVTSTVTLAGTMAGTAGTLVCTGTATLTANGKTLTGKISFGGTSQTYTLADAWVVNGSATSTGTSPVINGGSISCGGFSGNANESGTTVITITGGTWNNPGGGGSSALVLAGNITMSGTSIVRTGGSVTYSSGTITQGTTRLQVSGNTTLDTGGMTWTAFTATGTGTITFNSLFLATTFQFGNGTPTLAGAFGFTVGTLVNGSTLDANRTLTFTQTNTYTITTAFNLQGLAGKLWTLASSSATLRVPIVFSGSTQSVQYVSATRVDSSAGTTVHSPGGVLTDTLNWDTAGASGTMWLFS